MEELDIDCDILEVFGVNCEDNEEAGNDLVTLKEDKNNEEELEENVNVWCVFDELTMIGLVNDSDSDACDDGTNFEDVLQSTTGSLILVMVKVVVIFLSRYFVIEVEALKLPVTP